jgi:hypothetical protein
MSCNPGQKKMFAAIERLKKPKFLPTLKVRLG